MKSSLEGTMASATSKFVPARPDRTFALITIFTMRRRVGERRHAAISTAERTMTPAEARLSGVDLLHAITERTTNWRAFV